MQLRFAILFIAYCGLTYYCPIHSEGYTINLIFVIELFWPLDLFCLSMILPVYVKIV